MGKYINIFATTLSNEFLIKSSTIENLRIPLGKDIIEILIFSFFSYLIFLFIYIQPIYKRIVDSGLK